MYFVNKGERIGQFLMMVDFDEKTKIYSVLGLPESEPLYISEKDIYTGIETKILDFVDTIPPDVFKDCQNEFQYRINHK